MTDVFLVKLVAGSAVMAFEDVCPERIDLIHKNYRKLCNLLIDIDEWGQVAVIHMLTRYARTQFVDPNKEVKVSFAAHTNCEVMCFLVKVIQDNVPVEKIMKQQLPVLIK